MITTESKDAPHAAGRWLAQGEQHLGVLLQVLNEYEQLRGRIESIEQENERLRGLASDNENLRHRAATAERECAHLRDATARLQAELERDDRERRDLADLLTQIMNDILARLRAGRT